MISKGEASPKRGPERKRTERMATTLHSQLDGATHPLYTRGHHHHPPPPPPGASTPPTQHIISPSSHHPPHPLRFMLLQVHTRPEQDSNIATRASISSPSRPPSSHHHHHQPDMTKPDQHPIQYLPNGAAVVILPSSLIVPSFLPSRVSMSHKPPQRNGPPSPFPGGGGDEPLPLPPKKPCPNGILTVPNAQSQLQYIDAMHNPPPGTPQQPLTTASRN